jgi:hypothetical protein
MKKLRPSAPDHPAPSDDDAGSAGSIAPHEIGSAGAIASGAGTEGGASPPGSRVEPEEMGGEAPCHLPRFWDVDD